MKSVFRFKADWLDYVFTDEYRLLPLVDLEKFIVRNGHLPDMPTAKEVKEEGLKTGETICLLTVKVEELTLYILQQQKEIEMLKEEFNKN